MSDIPGAEHPNCVACKLHEECYTPFMEMSTNNSTRAQVLFVGEAPGASEDKEGIPFVGKSGEILRTNAEDELELDCGYTNSIRCRPPNNAKPTMKQIKLCRPFVLADIERSGAEVVVLLGNTALGSVLGEKGITQWRGSIVPKEDKTYYPMLHPAAILTGRGSDEMRTQWIEDLVAVSELSETGLSDAADSHYEYIYVDTVQAVEEMYKDIKEEGECAFDLEFVWKEVFVPGNKILLASFATSNKAWAVPLNHDDTPFSSDELLYVMDILDELLLDYEIGKKGHNLKIDCLMVKIFMGVDVAGVVGDTMLLSQIIDSRQGVHSLKHLANKLLGMYNYDQPLEDYKDEHPEADYNRKGGHYGNVPLGVLWLYAAKDASATWLLEEKLLPLLTDKQLVLYRELLPRCVSAFTRMEANGSKPDLGILEEYTRVYEDTNNDLLKQMRSDADVVKLEAEKNKDLDAKIDALEEEMEDNLDDADKFLSDIEKLENRRDIFNPGSSMQVAQVLFELKGYDVPKDGYTKTGRPSVKADVIKWLKGPWLDLYREWKLYHSALTKYLYNIHGWTGIDGRIHSNYNIIGTRTGRTSSNSPNMQNIPTPEKEPGTLLESHPIKNSFVHSWKGGCIYANDFGSIEMRVMASMSASEAMVRMFSKGKDPHTFVASKLFGIPEEEVTKPKRYRAKWVNWTMLFRGSRFTLRRLYGLSKKESADLESGWYAIFPEVISYGQELIEFAREHGYTESPLGRRRHFPFIVNSTDVQMRKSERAAVNHPIQSTASDLLLMSLVILDDILRNHNMKSLLINTVHDSLVFDVYPGELEDLHELVMDVMVNLIDYSESYFPGVDLSWLKVPLVADAEIGSHYGSLEHYG